MKTTISNLLRIAATIIFGSVAFYGILCEDTPESTIPQILLSKVIGFAALLITIAICRRGTAAKGGDR